jgi:hypothetical protein
MSTATLVAPVTPKKSKTSKARPKPKVEFGEGTFAHIAYTHYLKHGQRDYLLSDNGQIAFKGHVSQIASADSVALSKKFAARIREAFSI